MNENNDINEKQIDLICLFKTIWSRRKAVIKWGGIGAIIGIVIAFSIPKTYTSIAKVAPEMQQKELGGSAGALADMMGLGGNSGLDAINYNIYPEVISSTPFVLEFADIEVDYQGESISMSDYILKNQKRAWWSYVFGLPSQAIGWTIGLFSDKSESDTLTIKDSPRLQYAFKSAINQSILVEQDKKQGLLTISSSFQDPAVAKIISDSILIKLKNYMVEYRTAKTRSNLESNIKMLDIAKANYHKAEQEYADALDKNKNLVSQSAKVKLDRLLNERNLTFQIYSQLAIQVEADRVKLEENKPIVAVIEPSTTPIRASSPNKLLIIIGFAFLGGFIISSRILIKEIL